MINIDEIRQDAEIIRDRLSRTSEVGKYIDTTLPIPKLYQGSSSTIDLFIIGQDPTIQNEKERSKITTVLKLDQLNSPLRRYISRDVCESLNTSLDNVYATNACKCFFTEPPTSINRDDGIDVLESTLQDWLPLLQKELGHFSNAIVITLGEPILSMLVREQYRHKLRTYWGYKPGWNIGKPLIPMSAITEEQNWLSRVIYPYVHQPNYVRAKSDFYRKHIVEYGKWIRDDIHKQSST